MADFLSKPLTVAIDNSLRQGIFPDEAKIASAATIDKGKPSKNDISNYRPVSLLHILSKIYENVIKDFKDYCRVLKIIFLPSFLIIEKVTVHNKLVDIYR